MTAAAVSDRSRDYVAFMRCDAGDKWMSEATSQVASWLGNLKRIDVDLDRRGDYTFDRTTLKVRPLAQGDGQDFHLELREDGGDAGTWSTGLLIHDEPGGRGWISIQVRNSVGLYVKVPNLARYLMQVLPLGDGEIHFTDGPQLFHSDDVGHLVEVLADQQRHGLVFVAATSPDDSMLTPFTEKVDQWARDVYGLAQVVILDPAATEEFAGRAGPQFAAPAWTIRTYQPGVDFGSDQDWRRHRILGTHSLATRSDASIASLLGDIARQQAATRPPSAALLRSQRRLARIETKALVDAALPEASPLDATPAPQLDQVDRLTLSLKPPSDADGRLEMVARVLGLEEVTEERLLEIARRARQRHDEAVAAHGLRARLEALQSDLERLQDEHQELEAALSDAQYEAECAHLDDDGRESRIQWLESRLKDMGDYEARYLEIPPEYLTSRPANFDDVLQRIERLEGVSFTGDATEVERLNQIDTNDAALRTAWDAVLALEDYVRARREGACQQGIRHYLSHTPAGYRPFPPGKFGETETGVTMRSFGSERVFPIPQEVDPTGQVTMKAHFKLARIGMASPRMYVYDAHPRLPHVYIGYLGVHLTNTHTR